MSYYSLEPPVSTSLTNSPSPLLVVPDSPYRIRRFVETFAKHFRREFAYDFVPFEAAETPTTLGYIPYEAYLFHEVARDLLAPDYPVKHRCFGACVFRRVECENAPACWSLQWVWLHPYFRNRGYLSEIWPEFIQKYGSFNVELPLSAAMEKFLEKKRHIQQQT